MNNTCPYEIYKNIYDIEQRTFLLDRCKEIHCMTDKEFVSFIDETYGIFEQKQNKFLQEYDINGYTQYFYDNNYDNNHFTLTFSQHDSKPNLVFKVIPIGSFSYNTDTFMWSWGWNWDKNNKKPLSSMQNIYKVTGQNYYMQAHFDSTELLTHELVSTIIDYYDAIGFYSAPDKHLRYFFAVLEKIV